jgi:D-inositol-3-phosphate glycosyltransferase
MAGRNVIILGSAYPLRGGGISSYNERLARAFQGNGDKVKIITFSLQYPSFLFPGKTQYSSEQAPTDLDIEVLVNSVNPINWFIVGNKISKQKPDLLIMRYWIPFIGPCLGTIARIVRKNKHTRIVSIVDNIIPHEKRPGDKLFSAYFLKPMHGFITMSHQVMNDLGKFDRSTPRKFCHHPLYDHFGEIKPQDSARKKLGLDPDSRYVLFFGFIRDYKGLDLLLKAMGDKRLKSGNIKIIVAGEFYSDPKPYLNIIREYKLEEYVILSTDFLPDNKVADYFNAADLVVQPYKDATQSGVTQVAYHFEKPMITTNVGGLAEIVPHGKVGYVVKPEVSEIANAIMQFFDDNKSAEFIKNLKVEKQKYTWDKMINAIEEIAYTGKK